MICVIDELAMEFGMPHQTQANIIHLVDIIQWVTEDWQPMPDTNYYHTVSDRGLAANDKQTIIIQWVPEDWQPMTDKLLSCNEWQRTGSQCQAQIIIIKWMTEVWQPMTDKLLSYSEWQRFGSQWQTNYYHTVSDRGLVANARKTIIIQWVTDRVSLVQTLTVFMRKCVIFDHGHNASCVHIYYFNFVHLVMWMTDISETRPEEISWLLVQYWYSQIVPDITVYCRLTWYFITHGWFKGFIREYGVSLLGSWQRIFWPWTLIGICHGLLNVDIFYIWFLYFPMWFWHFYTFNWISFNRAIIYTHSWLRLILWYDIGHKQSMPKSTYTMFHKLIYSSAA